MADKQAQKDPSLASAAAPAVAPASTPEVEKSARPASALVEETAAKATLSAVDVPESIRGNMALFLRLVRKVLEESDPEMRATFDVLLDDAIKASYDEGGATEEATEAFADLERLPRSEQGRWCVWKSVELLYLLSAGGTADPPPGGMNPAIARAAAAARAYMSTHLDERLTIPELSRRFCVSATALKAAFRALYGQPIHSWLREKRMERAAELLRRSDMSVLDISQAVGFASPSQFGANFLKRFGASPAKFRKMSVSGETTPETGGQGSGVPV